MNDEPEKRERIAIGLGLIVASILLWWRSRNSFSSVVDDAYISARYADHLLAGNGIVYNAGEFIEGYTDLAWVLCLAGCMKVGLPINMVLPGLGLFFALLCLPLSMLLSRTLGARGWAASLLAPFLIACDANWAVGSTIGLESSQFAACVFAAILGVEHARGTAWRVGAGVFCGLLGGVRPEGYVLGAVIVLYDLWRSRTKERYADKFDLAAAALVAALGLLAWRYHTYGSIIANTFIAKSKRDTWPQIKRNYEFYAREGVYFIVVIATFAVGAFNMRKNLLAMVCAAMALSVVAIAFRVHEWMPGARLLLPSLGITVCLFAASVGSMEKKEAVWYYLPMAPFTLLLLFGDMNREVASYDRANTVLPGNGAEFAAKHIRKYGAKGITLATRDAGVLSFFIGPDIRLAELHERALTQLHPNGAHVKIYDFTPKNPEIIVLTNTGNDEEEPGFAPEAELWSNLSVPYEYLGRVSQHPKRFYDVYTRKDIHMPPLPSEIVLGFQGPAPPNVRPSKEP